MKEPTVIKSTLSAEAKAAANEAKLPMPLALELALPKAGVRYEGTHKLDGDGPLGPMRLRAQCSLTISATGAWPAQATLEYKPTAAAMLGLDGRWMEQAAKDLPPKATLPPVTMDKAGSAPGNYNPGEAPLSFLGELWPLPASPLDIGDKYVEPVKAQTDEFFSFPGTREITFVGTKMVEGKRCAILAVRTELRGKPANPKETTLNLLVTSDVKFDVDSGWPLEATQKSEFSGKVDEGGGRVRDFGLKMQFILNRIAADAAKPAADVAKPTDAVKPVK